jgi:hypothetical protein
MGRTKQALCSPNVDFLKVHRGCFTSTSDCRQVDYLLDFVFFENLLDHRRLIKIPRNYDSTLANERWCLRVSLSLSENAHQPRAIECCHSLGDMTANQTAGPGQQN